ncbi:hypothetical protein EON83_29515 [bacterium]|nr:MAG: hypothetical protein EON83_29515 [bacterium]
MNYLKPLALLPLLFVSGCQYADTIDAPVSKPRIADLVGVWEPTAETIDNMKNRGKYQISTHQIIIKSDGTFTATNIPDCAFSVYSLWEDSKQKFKSGKGTWRLSNHSDEGRMIWDIEFYSTTKGVDSLPATPLPCLVGQQPPYQLHFAFGDADFGHALDFQRIN